MEERKGGDQVKSLSVKLGVILIGLAIFGYVCPILNIANAQNTLAQRLHLFLV